MACFAAAISKAESQRTKDQEGLLACGDMLLAAVGGLLTINVGPVSFS
jgi:hypothetical protein